jgi:hypothetical protein
VHVRKTRSVKSGVSRGRSGERGGNVGVGGGAGGGAVGRKGKPDFSGFLDSIGVDDEDDDDRDRVVGARGLDGDMGVGLGASVGRIPY